MRTEPTGLKRRHPSVNCARRRLYLERRPRRTRNRAFPSRDVTESRDVRTKSRLRLRPRRAGALITLRAYVLYGSSVRPSVCHSPTVYFVSKRHRTLRPRHSWFTEQNYRRQIAGLLLAEGTCDYMLRLARVGDVAVDR